MTMLLKFLGVRGSRPTHKRTLLGYGGNSTAFEIIIPEADFHLFVDGGSGLVARGESLVKSPEHSKFKFLITHTHWDHILGLPFFKPLHNPNNEFVFYASNTTRSTFNALFTGMQRGANLPIPRSSIKANIQFETIATGQTFSIDNMVTITTYQLNHQGITLGYRISRGDASVCIVTDNAPIENGNYMGEGMATKAITDPAQFERDYEKGLVEFLRDAHTVVFDTHFTEANLKATWGHSTPPRALEFCKKAGVSRLILFHHAPEDKDQEVDNKVQSIFHDACQEGIEVEAAREGETWDLCG